MPYLHLPDYEEYLAWLDEQECPGCPELNKDCICRELEDRWGDVLLPTDEELESWASIAEMGEEF